MRLSETLLLRATMRLRNTAVTSGTNALALPELEVGHCGLPCRTYIHIYRSSRAAILHSVCIYHICWSAILHYWSSRSAILDCHAAASSFFCAYTCACEGVSACVWVLVCAYIMYIMYIYLSIYLSIYLFIYLSIYLSIYAHTHIQHIFMHEYMHRHTLVQGSGFRVRGSKLRHLLQLFLQG